VSPTFIWWVLQGWLNGFAEGGPWRVSVGAVEAGSAVTMQTPPHRRSVSKRVSQPGAR